MSSGKFSLPLKVPMIRLLMMCHSWGSPVFLAMMRCCLHGDTSKCVIGPPGTVMQRICDGRGTGNQPVKGTSCKCFEYFCYNLQLSHRLRSSIIDK